MKAWIEGKKRVGPWKVRWREIIDGKPKKKASPLFRSLSEAAAELEAVNLRLAKIDSLNPKRRTHLLPMDQVVHRWKQTALSNGAVRDHYANELERVVMALCVSQGWQYTNQITATAVEAWRTSKARGHTKPVAMLKSLLRWARGVLKQPIDQELLDLPTVQPAHRPAPPLLTPEQVAEIIARAYTFGEAQGAAIEHLSLFGCRPIDVCRLNVADWNPRSKTLTLQVTKSRTRPEHPISGPFEAHAKRLTRLAAGRRPDAPLFVSATGTRWRIDAGGTSRQLADWYWWHVSDSVETLEKNQRGIQCLKDYAISALENAGVDDATKKLFTGHKTASVYERYKTTNQDRAAAALEKLGAKSAPTGGKVGGTFKLRGQKRGPTKSPDDTDFQE